MTAIREGAFTLVELIVVVAILVILLTISSFLFLDALRKAADKAAQETLRHALGAASVTATEDDSFVSATAAGLTALEPAFVFVDAPTPSTKANEVSVNVLSGTTWVATAVSRTGTCFAIKSTTGTSGRVSYGSSTGGGPCEANQAWALSVSGSRW